MDESRPEIPGGGIRAPTRHKRKNHDSVGRLRTKL
jgi:hypothetical protein